MRRVARLSALALLALALPVWLAIPVQASDKCTPHRAAFGAKGLVTGGSLSRDPGKKKRYSGTLDVTVTRTNKRSRAFLGPQSFTLTHVRVFHRHGIDLASPAGNIARLEGTIHVTRRTCPAPPPDLHIREVELRKPKK
jgi:hypothetical protein